MKKLFLLTLIPLLVACGSDQQVKETVLEEQFYKCQAEYRLIDSKYIKSNTDYFFVLTKVKSDKSPEGFYWKFGYTYDTQAINSPVLWMSGSKRASAFNYEERIGAHENPNRQTEFHSIDVFTSYEIIGTMHRYEYQNNQVSAHTYKNIGLNKLEGRFFIKSFIKSKTFNSETHITGGNCVRTQIPTN